MTELVDRILEMLGWLIELISAGVLLIGFARSFTGFLRAGIHWPGRGNQWESLPLIRRQMGMYILLGLDFYIVSDIIHSMIRPDWNDLISLAVIVLLRTTIGFFLGKEMAEIEMLKSENSIH